MRVALDLSQGIHIHTHSEGVLWTKDRPVAKNSLPDNTQNSPQTHTHTPGGARNFNPSKRAATDRRPRPRGDQDGQIVFLEFENELIT